MYNLSFEIITSIICYVILTISNGDNEIRTRDLLLARQALSQLSYTSMILATTYSPVPSPVKYHRPLTS